MKSLNITDVGALRNELRKYKSGRKLDIRQFNQAARLAWLGRMVMAPLDPADPDTRSSLVYFDPPDGFIANFVRLDEDLVEHIFVLDEEQARALGEILEQGVRERAALYGDLDRRDFYFEKFYRSDEGNEPE